MSTKTNRQKLAELLKADPDLVAEIRELISDEPQASEDVEALFEGTSEDRPTNTQTRKSLKYEVWATLDGVEDDGDDTPKALVVAYLPPEVAAESITVTVASVGPKAQARTIKARRRKAS